MRQDKVGAAREKADGRVAAARDTITAAASKAEAELRKSAARMARDVAAAILGRELSK